MPACSKLKDFASARCAAPISALQRKALNQMHATGENRRLLEAYVEGALIAYRAAQKLIEELFRRPPDLYFNEYSMVLGAAVAASGKARSVPITRL